MPTPRPQIENKLLGLEVLRFIAAFAVLIWHYRHFAYDGARLVGFVPDQLPLYGLLWPFYGAGLYGVQVFWCISGFIFYWKYRESIHDRTTGGEAFLVLRLSRLYPLHIVTLMAVALLQPVFFDLKGTSFIYQVNDLKHFVMQIFLASYWGMQDGASFNGPIWSISVEVLAYASFFLTLRYVTRSPWLNACVVLVCMNFEGQIFVCMTFFYAGGLVAIAREAISQKADTNPTTRLAWCLVVIAPLAMWILMPGLIESRDHCLLALMPAVLICCSYDFTVAPAARKLIEAAGNMTYSSYLLHFPIQLMIAIGFAAAGMPIPYYDPMFFAAFLVTTLLASYATYRWFEAPAQTWLRGRLLPAPNVFRLQKPLSA